MFCDGSDALQTESDRTGIQGGNGLIARHKEHVDNTMTYNVKHSLIRNFSNRSHTSVIMNIESSSSAASEHWQNSASCKPGGASPFAKEGESFPSQGKGEMGRKVNGFGIGGGVGGGSSTVIRAEPRFETFLMTGDMIIKTTNVSRLDRIVRDNETKVSDDFRESEGRSPVPPLPLLSEDHRSSPNGTLLQGTTAVLQTVTGGMAQNMNSVAREQTEHLSTDCKEKLKSDLPNRDDRSCFPALPQLELLGCPRFADIPIELDIPPDDISSEDERCRMEGELNIDDLPPPPDEFLTDFTPHRALASLPETIPKDSSFGDDASGDLSNSLCHLDSCSTAENQIPLRPRSTNTQDIRFEGGTNAESHDHGVTFSSNLEKESFFFNTDIGAGSPAVKSMIVSSRSEERLSPRTVSEKSKLPQDLGGIVRGSKSQENYLQCDNDGVVIDIDFGEHGATSVDTLHYPQSGSCIESLGFTRDRAIQSLHSSPEKRIQTRDDLERPLIQTSFGPELVSKAAHHGSMESGKKSTTERNATPPAPPERGVSSLGNFSINRSDAIKSYFGEELPPPPPKSFQTSGEAGASTDLVTLVNPCGDVDELNETPSQIPLNCIKTRDGADGGAASREGSESRKQLEEWKRPSDTEASSAGSADDDDDLREDLFRLPTKDVDRPSARRLAKRLYCLEGFQKTDVAKHLCKKNDFAQLVGEEYLRHFDFTLQSLDVALRFFLQHLVLSGETQERERILVHFSHRFLECNPGSFSSEDSCHTLTCAMLLLNTDLHRPNAGKKMTLEEFVENLADLNDGDDFPKELLRSIYRSIQNEPIEFEVDDMDVFEAGPKGPSCTLGSNPFLDVLDPSKAKEFKNGFVMRKCCIDPDGRRTAFGKRSWKMFYMTLRDLVLYLYKDQQGLGQQTHFHTSNNAIRIHHSLATIADDYRKKQHVFRLQTTDGAEYLFQTSKSGECQSWIDSINFVVAALSAPPLPSAVGSQRKFQRPLMPSSCTKLSLVDQLSQHIKMLQRIENDLYEHTGSPPDKGSKSRMIQDYLEKESYLQFEQKRFKMYCSMLEGKLQIQSQLSDFPSLEVTIGEVDETNIANTTSPNDIQRSATVQRSMSDRLVRPFVRQHQSQNQAKNYSSMHSAKSLPSIFQPRKPHKDRSSTTTWYAELHFEDDTELTYC